MSLVSSIDDCLRLSDRHASAQQVHLVVGNALRSIAPDVTVRATDYFTHTFVPDLILDWGSKEERQVRHVHLRFGVNDATFLGDVDLLAESEPVFLGLRDSRPIDPRLTHRKERGHAGTLVTAASAIDVMDQSRARDRSALPVTRELVRGGRGAVDAERASRIVQDYRAAVGAIDRLDDGVAPAHKRTYEALATLRGVLRLPQFESLERDLRSRWIRTGGDPFEFPGHSEWDPRKLSDTELAEVLNALLDSGRALSRRSWERIAARLTAQELADILGRDRTGGSLNHLAAALVASWTAQWAWTERLSIPMGQTFAWLISEKTLGLQIGDRRIFFRDDGRRFRGKKPTGDPLPTIAQAEAFLRDADVQAAKFASDHEDIDYTLRAAAGQTLYERVLVKLSDSVNELRVEEVTTRVPGRDHTVLIQLDRQIIDTEDHPTAISSLIRLAHRFFFHDGGEDWDRVELFLNSGGLLDPEPGEAF